MRTRLAFLSLAIQCLLGLVFLARSCCGQQVEYALPITAPIAPHWERLPPINAPSPLPFNPSLMNGAPIESESSDRHIAPQLSAPFRTDGVSAAPAGWRRLWTDQRQFYSPETLTLVGGGLIVAGAIANTSADAHLLETWHDNNWDAPIWRETLHDVRRFGDGRYALPAVAGSWLVGALYSDSPWGETMETWSERTLRGILVGGPPAFALQQFTGGSRPIETHETSEWHPFQDNNGVSGHSFIGSLPFLTAAKMAPSPQWKAAFYAGSILVPISRMSDDSHYPSQVALGWWLAYLAASAVDGTDNPDRRWNFYQIANRDFQGALWEFRF